LGLDFGGVLAPFWEGFGCEGRKIGVQEAFENEAKKEREKEDENSVKVRGLAAGAMGSGKARSRPRA